MGMVKEAVGAVGAVGMVGAVEDMFLCTNASYHQFGTFPDNKCTDSFRRFSKSLNFLDVCTDHFVHPDQLVPPWLYLGRSYTKGR